VVRRVERDGFLELLFSLIRFRPFRCQLCTYRFRRFAFGARYSKVDRRQYERLATQVQARIMGKPTRGDDLVTDLSMDGCRLKTDTPLIAGAFLHLRLRMSNLEPPIIVQTAMVRSVYSDSVGLEFLDFDAKQKDHLSQFVRDLLAPHSSNTRSEQPVSRQ
jgi:hypothetical protein